MHRHKFLRHAAAVLAAAALLAAVVLAGLAAALPDTLYTDGPAAELEIASMPYLTVKKRQGSVAADSTTPDTSANVTLTLFGTLPVKTVRAVSTERRTVQVCGTPFGVKLFSDGALVVAFSDRYTALGSENPAKAAGLRLGDLIVSANGRPVRSNEDLTAAIQAADGAPLTVVYRRSGARHTATLTPTADENGHYKAGVWVRDSGAGIGTMPAWTTPSSPRQRCSAGSNNSGWPQAAAPARPGSPPSTWWAPTWRDTIRTAWAWCRATSTAGWPTSCS